MAADASPTEAMRTSVDSFFLLIVQETSIEELKDKGNVAFKRAALLRQPSLLTACVGEADHGGNSIFE